MLHGTIRVIERILELIGKAVALLVLVVTGLIVYEMTARGVFGTSSPWAHELSTWLLTAFVFLGGPWALTKGQFVRVDVLHATMSPKTKAVIDTVVSSVLFALFAGVLVWFGSKFALTSFGVGERSATGGWGGPVWVAKALVPIGSTLLCLAWLAHVLRLWRDALHPETKD